MQLWFCLSYFYPTIIRHTRSDFWMTTGWIALAIYSTFLMLLNACITWLPLSCRPVLSLKSCFINWNNYNIIPKKLCQQSAYPQSLNIEFRTILANVLRLVAFEFQYKNILKYFMNSTHFWTPGKWCQEKLIHNFAYCQLLKSNLMNC